MSAAALPIASGRSSLRVIVALLLRRPFVGIGAALALVADAASSLVAPVAVGLLVDAVGGPPASRGSVLVTAVVLLVVAALVQAITSAVSAILVVTTTEPALAALREDALSAGLHLDPARLERAGVGDLVARLTGDIERLSEVAGGTLAAFVSSGLVIALTLGGLLALDPRFALAGLLGLPIQVLTVRWYVRRSSRVYRRVRTAESGLHQRLLASIVGASTVRAYGDERLHEERIERRSLLAVRLGEAAFRLSTRFYGRLNIAEAVGLGAVLATGFLLVSRGDVPLGAVATAALFFTRLFDPINTVLGLADTVQQGASSLTRVVGLIEARPVVSDVTVAAVTRPGPAVRLVDVVVRYGTGPAAVDGVSLTLERGTRVAVVGTSGAGKTTLGRLIAGTLDPTGGRVDRGLRSDVVLLDQAVHVFAGTLRDDLRLAAPHADDCALEEALAMAGFAAQLPSGLETVIGAGGHQLTAAEAQHLALARLVLRDPELAVLDEATADAGSASAAALERATGRVLAGRTALVIAHRLTQADAADRVMVLEAGRIVEDGSPAALRGAGGPYSRLHAAWDGARGVVEAPGRVVW
ncbi:MAG: Xenobiotic-transporting ATPase [Frondihabitans sp.]|nr:Xenobiotic-transporting ATPase [Frondihabitans sp.]